MTEVSIPTPEGACRFRGGAGTPARFIIHGALGGIRTRSLGLGNLGLVR